MRMMIKKLLKKHKYPPEGMDDAVQTVMNQCELWTDNNDMIQEKDEINLNSKVHSFNEEKNFMLVADVTNQIWTGIGEIYFGCNERKHIFNTNGNKQFLIPVYQRYYSWDIEQCKRLWNDIVGMQKKNKQGHFVGSIVNIAEQAMPTGVQKYMIIDGQQRMTTLTLLLIALRDYSIDHPEDISINFEIDNMLLKNEYENGDERYKLLLTENDRDILINLIERKPISENISVTLIDES